MALPSFRHALVDDSQLAERLQDASDWRWMLTYDKNPEILKLYPSSRVQRFEYTIRYSANKRGCWPEFMFASNKTLMRSYDTVTLNQVKEEQ